MKALMLLLALVALGSCNKEPAGEYFTEIEYFVDTADKARLVAEIGSANDRLDVAITRLTDTEIANAIVRAKERGAKVRVVADRDFRDDAGLQILEDAGIRPVYGDGELLYLPEPAIAGIVDSPCGFKDGVVRCPEPADSEPLEDYNGVEPAGAMYRPGSFNLMSHNFFIIDVRTIWNFTRPFDGLAQPQFGFRAESERMREVLEREFTQLYGGVFATTLDVYNGPVKSSPQENPDFNAKSYLTDSGELELRFNPQDRVTKTVIDDAYRARASVFLVTDTIGEDFLIDAMNYKAKAKLPNGDEAFEVRIIVNRAAQSPVTRDALEATGVVRYAPANIDALPTVAIYDALPDSQGDERPRRIHVSSQPLWRAGPFDIIRNDGSNPFCPQQTGSDCVVVYPADYFVDGNMWSLLEYRGQIHEIAEIDRFESWFNELWGRIGGTLKNLLLIFLTALIGLSCNQFTDEQLEVLGKPQVTAYFNSTGTREGNQHDVGAERALVERIDSATGTLDACIYGFSNQNIIDAVIRAHYRGVRVRVVGDARHFGYNERGYKQLQENHIPIQVGNQFHIMHNKFFVIDELFVFVGTGNITRTGFNRNNNNWLMIDSPYVAADFLAEFEQMYGGKFSSAKDRIENGNTYEVGDTTVEVYFSPQEDAMGRILEELDAADTNIHFTIFAFTKDQVGSRFIQKHREFSAANEASGDDSGPILDRPKRVVGILDRSQVHGNFLYHEVYRLTLNGVPMKMDANEASYLPGDYQAGGGRLHSKTMIIDRGTPNARVITGSFNWSSSATISNDEVMLILRGEKITEQYYREFQNLWVQSKNISQAVCNYLVDYDAETGEGPRCAGDVEPGDVLISEVGWYGWNGMTDPGDRSGQTRDLISNDEFIELYNTTDDPINLSLWTISNGNDFSVGFTPGTVIQPGQYFLILDHNIEAYSDSIPQRGKEAYNGGDFVMNLANDPRFPRLNLKDVAMDLRLVDTLQREIDRAGDGTPPFAGGPQFAQDGTVTRVRSMERDITKSDGTSRDSWAACSASEGGEHVNEEFRADVIATPGEPNSN